jgi:tetratricopeptide (TPR) repeat protein
MQELIYFQKANSLYMEYNKTLKFDLLDCAMEECNKAISMKADNAEAYYLRALINVEFEEYEEEEQDLNIALKIFFDRLNCKRIRK